MANFNFNDFLNILSDKQRAAVLSCRTESEFEQVIDDFDIQIPDEMLEQVAGGRGKFSSVIIACVIGATAAGATIASTGAATANAESAGYMTEWSEEKDNIDDYFDSLDFNEKTFFDCFLEDENTSKSHVVQNADGSVSVIQKVKVDDRLSSDSFAVSSADATAVFPGALLKADEGLVTGNPTQIMIGRRDLNISVPNAYMKEGCSSKIKVNPANASDVHDSINTLVKNFKDGTDFPAQMTAKIEKIESFEQIKAKMNFSQSMLGKLKIEASTDYQTKKQAVVVDISQVFYSINADTQTSADLFPDGMKLKTVQKRITNSCPAVMVSNVDYGKRILAVIETSDMSFDLKASVEASGLGGKISGGAEAEYKKKLNECNVRVFALGGSSANAGKFLTTNFEELLKVASESTKYDGYAVPVSYTTRWATSGNKAVTNYRGYTWKTVTTKSITSQIPVHFEFEQSTLLKKGTVKFYGRRVKGVNEDGSLIRGDEELIKCVTLDYSTSEDFKLPADVFGDSVRIVCDGEETGESLGNVTSKRIEDESVRSVSLQSLVYKARLKTAYDFKTLNIIIQDERAARVCVPGASQTSIMGTIWMYRNDGVITSVLGSVPVLQNVFL